MDVLRTYHSDHTDDEQPQKLMPDVQTQSQTQNQRNRFSAAPEVSGGAETRRDGSRAAMAGLSTRPLPGTAEHLVVE